MYLIVGLGNPEKDYSETRHNMGFNVVNKLSEKYNISVTMSKFNSLYGTGIINGEKIILVKPQTYMNLSGQAVKQFVDYYKLELDNLLIVYDDIDLDPGIIRIRKFGGPGTHNGMKSVVECLKNTNFARVRVGIGKPENENLIEYVIGAIDEEDKEKLKIGVMTAADAVDEIIKNNIDAAMNKYN